MCSSDLLKALTANTGKTYDISNGVNYCVNASDTDTTEINIVEAIEVKNGVTGAKIYKDWKSNDDKGTQVAASSAEFVKKGTELFLVADTANTIFDAVDGSGLVLTNVVAPNGSTAGVWKFNLDKTVTAAAATFKVVAQLPATDTWGYVTSPVEVVGLTDQASTNATITGVAAKPEDVTIAWDSSSGTIDPNDPKTITPTRTPATTDTFTLGAVTTTSNIVVALTTTATTAPKAADALGSVSVTVTYKDLSISAIVSLTGSGT